MAEDQKIGRAAKKAPLWLIAQQCLLGVARVFQYGAKKYKPGNWHQATLADGAAERYISAAARHQVEMQGADGLFTRETLAARDDESGGYHLDHAICSLLMLRGILIKEGVMVADPGELNAPPAAPKVGSYVEGMGTFTADEIRYKTLTPEQIQAAKDAAAARTAAYRPTFEIPHCGHTSCFRGRGCLQ